MPSGTHQCSEPAPRGRAPTSDRGDRFRSFPVLDRDRHGSGVDWPRRSVGRTPPHLLPGRLLIAFAAIATVSILLGLLVTRVLLPHTGLASDDERFVRLLADSRSDGLTDASLSGRRSRGVSSCRSSRV